MSTGFPLISRRIFLAGLAAGWAGSTAWAQETRPADSAWARLRRKLAGGLPSTLLFISDSTGYLETSGLRRFIRWLAARYPEYRVTEFTWAEWATNAPTGPRNYGEPIVIGEGTSAATLTVLNAVLPGAFAQAMIDGSRWTNMLAPLKGEAPDLIVWNHGHNHQAGIDPKQFPYGRGTFLAPIGRVALEFPTSPQAAIVQNPWRDNDGYDRVRDWWRATAEAMPYLTLVDGHAPFIKLGKSAELYKDNVHPSPRGYDLIFEALCDAWQYSLAGENGSPRSWPYFPADPLVANGDLADWTGDLPRNWRLIHGAAARKDTEHTFRGAPHSLALTGVTQNDGLQLSITGSALARVRGKTVSFAVLCYVPREAEHDIQVKFTTNSSDQVTGSIQFARDNWKWVVMAGCPVPSEASLAYVSIIRSFAKPPTGVPFYIQRAIIVEGDVPRGGM